VQAFTRLWVKNLLSFEVVIIWTFQPPVEASALGIATVNSGRIMVITVDRPGSATTLVGWAAAEEALIAIVITGIVAVAIFCSVDAFTGVSVAPVSGARIVVVTNQFLCPAAAAIWVAATKGAKIAIHPSIHATTFIRLGVSACSGCWVTYIICAYVLIITVHHGESTSTNRIVAYWDEARCIHIAWANPLSVGSNTSDFFTCINGACIAVINYSIYSTAQASGFITYTINAPIFWR
jgi:hypothetical protein